MTHIMEQPAAYGKDDEIKGPRSLNLGHRRRQLERINRELKADFPVEAFSHAAIWVRDLGRVEMRLVCNVACEVTIGGQVIGFRAGEYIHTENAYKYDVAEFKSLAVKAGLSPGAVWTDTDEKFSVHYFAVSDGSC